VRQSARSVAGRRYRRPHVRDGFSRSRRVCDSVGRSSCHCSRPVVSLVVVAGRKVGGVECMPSSVARRQRCRAARVEPGVVPADTRRGEDAAEWGEGAGERSPVTHSNRREDRRRAPTRGESSDTDEVWCRSRTLSSGQPTPHLGGTHGCAQCESWVGARLRSALTHTGGDILMGQERFRRLKAPPLWAVLGAALAQTGSTRPRKDLVAVRTKVW